MPTLARPGFANLTSLLALVVALGGTGYAATALPRNSVGAVQIKQGAVGTSEVANRSLRAQDLARGVIPAAPDLRPYATRVARSGETLGGVIGVRYVPHTSNPFILAAGSFGRPLPAGVPSLLLETTGTTSPQCPGPGRAAAGVVCLYADNTENINLGQTVLTSSINFDPEARRLGFVLNLFPATATSPAYVTGSWAYRVP